MRFLVDQNLPPALAVWLRDQGYAADHTSEIGLDQIADRIIWAKTAGACIISKDEDFVLLKLAQADGPQVVWIRIGNAVRRHLLVVWIRIGNAVRRHLLAQISVVWPDVARRLEAGESIVEIR
jgi:predicted nuclease of predicted toxin-antitoxin system